MSILERNKWSEDTILHFLEKCHSKITSNLAFWLQQLQQLKEMELLPAVFGMQHFTTFLKHISFSFQTDSSVQIITRLRIYHFEIGFIDSS